MPEVNSNAPALFLLNESRSLESIMSSVHILYIPSHLNGFSMCFVSVSFLRKKGSC